MTWKRLKSISPVPGGIRVWGLKTNSTILYHWSGLHSYCWRRSQTNDFSAPKISQDIENMKKPFVIILAIVNFSLSRKNGFARKSRVPCLLWRQKKPIFRLSFGGLSGNLNIFSQQEFSLATFYFGDFNKLVHFRSIQKNTKLVLLNLIASQIVLCPFSSFSNWCLVWWFSKIVIFEFGNSAKAGHF